MEVCIEEKNPLKQGLKQRGGALCKGLWFIEEKNPLKQGLKQPIMPLRPPILNIEEKNPLKQEGHFFCIIQSITQV